MKCDNQDLNYNCAVKMWELKTAIFGIDETNRGIKYENKN